MDTLSGETTLSKSFCLPSEKESINGQVCVCVVFCLLFSQVNKTLLRGMDTLSGETTLSKSFCLLSEKESINGQVCVCVGGGGGWGGPVREDPFLEGDWFAGAK